VEAELAVAEADTQLLERWSLLKGYQNNWRSLISVAKAVYSAISKLSESPPRPDGLVLPVAIALLRSTVFKELCLSREYADESLHFTFALAMAKHILDRDWLVLPVPQGG
jgi:hypothetical protein